MLAWQVLMAHGALATMKASWMITPGTALIPEIKPIRLGRKGPMPGGYMTCTVKCGSGVMTGMAIYLMDR
jgi:hypothetical protein